MSAADRSWKWRWVFVALMALFLFRLAFGLTLRFWSNDERNIYLLGLKYATTGLWPYFGPDVIHSRQQIPGALQSLLVGLPIRWTSWPESPYLLINALSFVGLLTFVGWCRRRWPEFGWPLLIAWIMTCPWSLEMGTHIYNPGYLLFSGCLMTVAMLEILPETTTGWWPSFLCVFVIGAAVGWTYQLHLSWVLVLAVGGLAGIRALWAGTMKPIHIAWGLMGLCVTMSTALPTVLLDGPGVLLATTAGNSALNLDNVARLPEIVAKFLSFGAFELTRFVGETGTDRWAFYADRWWLVVVGFPLIGIGALQPLFVGWMVGFDRRLASERRWLLVGAAVVVGLVWASFSCSTRPPISRSFYVFFPLAWVVTLAAYRPFVSDARWRRVLWGVVIAGVVYQGMIIVARMPGDNIFRDRDRVVRAIDEGDYRIVGERRKGRY